MPVYNKTNITRTGSIPDQNPPLDDEDEFSQRNQWKRFHTFAKVMYDVNMAVAVILALIGILLFLTILDRRLRSQSQMWYLYHLVGMTTFIALVLHTIIHSRISHDSPQLCFFAYYAIEYMFHGVGINLILINTEVYFTTVLPLERWQSRPFFRFIVLILLSWIVVCLLVAHVVINNNDGRSNRYYCFYIKDKSVRNARFAFRTLIPGIVCFLFTIAFIVTYVLKRSRVRFTSAPGEFREVTSAAVTDNSQWLRFTIFLNTVFVLRTAITAGFMFAPYVRNIDYYMAVVVLYFIHAETMYTLPMAMFFLSDVRSAVKAIVCKAIRAVSFGKFRFGDDSEILSVSFGHATDNNVP